MLIQTTRFGEVEIQDQDILTFPTGMLGFSAERHFVMIEDEMGSPFQWLQSLERQDLAFVTINPETAISDFSLDITVDHMKKLDTEEVEDLNVRVIVTMARKLDDVTINLQGPLLLNFNKKLGLQFVVADGRYNTRHPLFGDRLNLGAVQQTEEKDQQEIAQAG